MMKTLRFDQIALLASTVFYLLLVVFNNAADYGSNLPIIQHVLTMEADPALLELAGRAVPRLTGPVFLDNADYRLWVRSVWNAECADMESTAYAQVCWANHKPFLIVRGVSDLTGGQHAPNPINENEDAVAVLAAKTLHSILDGLP
jgi:nucleoside phosphorylase